MIHRLGSLHISRNSETIHTGSLVSLSVFRKYCSDRGVYRVDILLYCPELLGTGLWIPARRLLYDRRRAKKIGKVVVAHQHHHDHTSERKPIPGKSTPLPRSAVSAQLIDDKEAQEVKPSLTLCIAAAL